MRLGIAGCGALVCLLLTGCVEDWLGHPADATTPPVAVAWRASEATQQFIDTVRADLPPVVVDHAVFVESPMIDDDGWLAGQRRRIWRDATHATHAHGPWPDAYVMRLSELTRASSELIETWRFVLADVPTPLSGWPAAWQRVDPAPDGARRWLRDPGEPLGEPLGEPVAEPVGEPVGEPAAEQVWVDLRAVDDPAAMLARASDVTGEGRAVYVLGCMAGGMARWNACLVWLRQLDADAPGFVLLDTVTGISAVPKVLTSVLQQVDLYPRLRYASAYPHPAINTRISLDWLVWHDLLAAEDVAPLRELYAYDPLLFDLALKRRLRLPGTSLRLPAAVFGPAAAESTSD